MQLSNCSSMIPFYQIQEQGHDEQGGDMVSFIKQEMENSLSTTFNLIPQNHFNCYVNINYNNEQLQFLHSFPIPQTHAMMENFAFQPMESSFGSDPTHFQSFLQSNPNFYSPSFSALDAYSDPLHEYQCSNSSIFGLMGMVDSGSSSISQYDPTPLLPSVDYGHSFIPLDCFQGFDGNYGNNTLIPVKSEPPSLGEEIENAGCVEGSGILIMVDGDKGKVEIEDSGLNSDSEDPTEHYIVDPNENAVGNSSKAEKWRRKKKKKRGLPAKKVTAEKQRRQKLNHRLYMLRWIEPRSLLMHAIDYTKELLLRIQDLNKELQSPVSTAPSLPSITSHAPLPLSESPPSLLRPRNQLPMVDVEVDKETCFNIHIRCARRPGILSSTMSALDNIGLNVQNAIFSCFNGFSMDIFRAQKVEGDVEIHGDKIKEALLEIAA